MSIQQIERDRDLGPIANRHGASRVSDHFRKDALGRDARGPK